MINFIKGIIVGIFNIIPGLSGSALLVIFNLYEKCLEAISTFYKDSKSKFIFLLPIGLGIIVGTYIFSNIILILLKNCPTETYIIFTFFILGTIPHLFKEATKKGFKKSYLISFIFTFLTGLLLLFINTKDVNYIINYNFIGLIKYFTIGVVLSFSTVIPGISSTILLSLINLYSTYIYSISTLNLFVLIPTLIGFTITTYIISKAINFLLKKYYGYTYFAILGFCLSTIPCLLKQNLVFNSNIIISIVIGLIASIITYYSFKVVK